MALDRLGDGIMSGKVDPSKILDGVPEGARNNALWRLACWARYHDLPLKVCIMMLDEAAVNCNPPYTEAKTEDIASRAYARYPSGSTNGMQKSSRTSWTLTDLVQSDIDEPVWLIEKILPHGFCLFYAHPKTGKSIIMESLAVTLAKGQKAFGQLSTLKTDVLYLELELGESMAKKRWTKILGNRGLADGENVQIELEWPRHDQGGLLNLRNYLDQHPRTKVVVVDTLGAFWPTEALVKGTAYNTDYALGQSIASVAHDYQCAIVCVYHKTKTEHGDSLKNISSSMGLSAAADVLWDLKRDRESGDATIEISGKMVEPMTLDLIQRGSAFNFEMMELHGEEE